MQTGLKSAAIIVAVGIALAASGSANAAGIVIGLGKVSVGYADGYRDTNNGWHNWRTADANKYRKAHADQYHAWRHDDPKHQGDADH